LRQPFVEEKNLGKVRKEDWKTSLFDVDFKEPKEGNTKRAGNNYAWGGRRAVSTTVPTAGFQYFRRKEGFGERRAEKRN